MRAVLTSLIQLGGMQFTIAFTALLRNKILAARLGTDGFGAYAQLALIAITISVLVAFGLEMSLTRNVAAAGTREKRQRLLAQANGVLLLLSLLAAVLSLVVLTQAPWVLTRVGLEVRAEVVLAAIILVLFIPAEAAVHHRIAFLTGALDIAGMTKGRSLALFIGTLITLPLVWWFGLLGAALQLTLLTGFIAIFLDRRLRALGYKPWQVAYQPGAFRLLARFGLASLVVGFAQQIADLTVRTQLIQQLDASHNGIYQAALSITYQVKAVVLGSVGALSIATLSQDASVSTIRTTSKQLLAVVLPIGGVSLGGLGLLSGPAILLLYAPDFLPAQQVLPSLLTAEYLQVPIWVLGAPLLATGRVRDWMIFELAFAGLRAVASLALLVPMGVPGIALGVALATIVQFGVITVYAVRVFDLRMATPQAIVLVAGFATVIASVVLGMQTVFDLRLVVIGVAFLIAFALLGLHVALGIKTAWQRVQRAVRREVPA